MKPLSVRLQESAHHTSHIGRLVYAAASWEKDDLPHALVLDQQEEAATLYEAARRIAAQDRADATQQGGTHPDACL